MRRAAQLRELTSDLKARLPDGAPNLVGDTLGLLHCSKSLTASGHRDEARARLGREASSQSSRFEETERFRRERNASLWRVAADAVRVTATCPMLSTHVGAAGAWVGAMAGMASGGFGALLAFRQASRVGDARVRLGSEAREALAALVASLGALEATPDFVRNFVALEEERLDALELQQAVDLGKFAFGIGGALMSAVSALAPVVALETGLVDAAGMAFGVTSLACALAGGQVFARRCAEMAPRLEYLLAEIETFAQSSGPNFLPARRAIAEYLGVVPAQLLQPELARLALSLHFSNFSRPASRS